MEDFDWDAFENSVNSQSTEESSEETVDVTEHTIGPGTVISINRREVVVNIGYHSDGIIPSSEFRYNPELKVGEVVDVYV